MATNWTKLDQISENKPLEISQNLKRPSDTQTDVKSKKAKTLMLELAEEIKVTHKGIENVRKLLEAISNNILRIIFEGVLNCWQMALDDATNDRPVSSITLSLRFQEVDETEKFAHLIKAACIQATASFEIFATKYNAFQNARPSPSSYSKAWSEPQERFGDLLCMRPTKRTGLPLITLHDVFGTYHQNLADPLPESAISERRAADMLCSAMGESFDDEKQRTKAFQDCVADVLPTWINEKTYNPHKEATSAQIDGVLLTYQGTSSSFPLILREDKVEPGTAGDVHVQTSRDYQVLIHCLQEQKSKPTQNFLKLGAPMFLLYVVGPTLGVAGAFYDGKSCIIEPLGPSHWMLEDVTGGRQKALAQVLYALGRGVQRLQSLQSGLGNTPSNTYKPGVPRVYQTFKNLVNIDTTSQTPLERASPEVISTSHPCFASQLITHDAKSHPVLIKMVYSGYGDKVHKLLAEHGYAPTLYGLYEANGLPTLYVMEYLSDDWMTLFDFKQQHYAVYQLHQVAIRSTLRKVLDILEQNEFVHGDIRANNIMIQVKSNQPTPSATNENGVNLKLIDFDWAGKTGEVHYPAYRNDDIEGIEWPSAAGTAIVTGHDRMLVDSWMR